MCQRQSKELLFPGLRQFSNKKIDLRSGNVADEGRLHPLGRHLHAQDEGGGIAVIFRRLCSCKLALFMMNNIRKIDLLNKLFFERWSFPF